MLLARAGCPVLTQSLLGRCRSLLLPERQLHDGSALGVRVRRRVLLRMPPGLRSVPLPFRLRRLLHLLWRVRHPELGGVSDAARRGNLRVRQRDDKLRSQSLSSVLYPSLLHSLGNVLRDLQRCVLPPDRRHAGLFLSGGGVFRCVRESGCARRAGNGWGLGESESHLPIAPARQSPTAEACQNALI